jgi:hypothetical protein
MTQNQTSQAVEQFRNGWSDNQYIPIKVREGIAEKYQRMEEALQFFADFTFNNMPPQPTFIKHIVEAKKAIEFDPLAS